MIDFLASGRARLSAAVLIMHLLVRVDLVFYFLVEVFEDFIELVATIGVHGDFTEVVEGVDCAGVAGV